jgi:hypothetical protein
VIIGFVDSFVIQQQLTLFDFLIPHSFAIDEFAQVFEGFSLSYFQQKKFL